VVGEVVRVERGPGGRLVLEGGVPGRDPLGEHGEDAVGVRGSHRDEIHGSIVHQAAGRPGFTRPDERASEARRRLPP
jgi:hypothetical protein